MGVAVPAPIFVDAYFLGEGSGREAKVGEQGGRDDNERALELHVGFPFFQ
jgi:hypothetical protein